MVATHEAQGDVDADRIAEAKRWLLSAEGSDWFWWYGDDFQTDNAAEFDALFRERLTRAAALVGEPAPPRLAEPLSRQAGAQTPPAAASILPIALIHPQIDGRADSYTKWLGAGVVEPSGSRGAMYQTASQMRSLQFGCDLETFFLRVEPTESWDDVQLEVELSNGREAPPPCRVEVRRSGGPVAVSVSGATGAYVDVVELALPLRRFHLAAHDQRR